MVIVIPLDPVHVVLAVTVDQSVPELAPVADMATTFAVVVAVTLVWSFVPAAAFATVWFVTNVVSSANAV
jgi:hypothetical protein